MSRLGFMIWRVALVLLACLAAPLDPVHATFQGTNGRITFARDVPETDSFEIFSIHADGTDEQQLTFDPPGRGSLFSDWSPDGSRIAIDSDRFSNGTDDLVQHFHHEG